MSGGQQAESGQHFLRREQCDCQQVDLELVSCPASGHDCLPPPLSLVSAVTSGFDTKPRCTQPG